MRGTKVQKANKRRKPIYARNLYQAEARIEELEKLVEAYEGFADAIRYANVLFGDGFGGYGEIQVRASISHLDMLLAKKP
jgi:hypothetical protein